MSVFLVLHTQCCSIVRKTGTSNAITYVTVDKAKLPCLCKDLVRVFAGFIMMCSHRNHLCKRKQESEEIFFQKSSFCFVSTNTQRQLASAHSMASALGYCSKTSRKRIPMPFLDTLY